MGLSAISRFREENGLNKLYGLIKLYIKLKIQYNIYKDKEKIKKYILALITMCEWVSVCKYIFSRVLQSFGGHQLEYTGGKLR